MNIGVIGLGYWGPNLARNIATQPEAQLAALCDLDEARLESQAQLYPGAKTTGSLSEILGDASIEAVAIATPVTSHYSLAKEALLAKKACIGGETLSSNGRGG